MLTQAAKDVTSGNSFLDPTAQNPRRKDNACTIRG